MTNLDEFITDEMLAAYIDGNAIPIEANIIKKHLKNEELQEVLDIVSDLKKNPEIIEGLEKISIDFPDNFFKDEEVSLQELKKDVEKPNEHIM